MFMNVLMYASMCMHACVCLCMYVHTYVCVYVYIYIYIYVCVCVCVYTYIRYMLVTSFFFKFRVESVLAEN